VLVSYITLRRVVGFLGVGLPVIVAVVGFVAMGFWRFEPTISDYYRIESARNWVASCPTIVVSMRRSATSLNGGPPRRSCGRDVTRVRGQPSVTPRHGVLFPDVVPTATASS